MIMIITTKKKHTISAVDGTFSLIAVAKLSWVRRNSELKSENNWKKNQTQTAKLSNHIT